MSEVIVSTIMPFLNSEKFIQEAIESVFAQTYHDWELLLVDDGSSDRSTEIALRYAKQHPDRVRYFDHDGHQNRGASVARNLGIRNARGKYIAFLDADDIWLRHKLEQQVPILDAHPEVAMLFGTSQWWYSWDGRSENAQQDHIRELGLPSGTLFQPPSLFIPFFLSRSVSTPCPCSIVVRQEVINQIGGFEESFHHIYTDQAFYAKLCLTAPVFAVDECWCKYRQHPDSSYATVTRLGQRRAARKFFLIWLAGYFHEQKFADPDIRRAIHAELWPYQHPTLHRLLTSIHYRLGQVSSLLRVQ